MPARLRRARPFAIDLGLQMSFLRQSLHKIAPSLADKSKYMASSRYGKAPVWAAGSPQSSLDP
jgi:hypothetical protein